MGLEAIHFVVALIQYHETVNDIERNVLAGRDAWLLRKRPSY